MLLKGTIVLLLVNFGSNKANRACENIQSGNVIQKSSYKDENGGDHCFFQLGPEMLETIALDNEKKLDTVGNYFTKLQTECKKIKEGSTLPGPLNKEMLKYFIDSFLRNSKNKYAALDIETVGTLNEKIQVKWANDDATDDFIDPNNVLDVTIPGIGKPLHWKNATVSGVTFIRGGESIDLISYDKDDRLIPNQPYAPFCQYSMQTRIRRQMTFPNCNGTNVEYAFSFTHSNGERHCLFRLNNVARDAALKFGSDKYYSYEIYDSRARKICNETQLGSHLPALSDKEIMENFIAG